MGFPFFAPGNGWDIVASLPATDDPQQAAAYRSDAERVLEAASRRLYAMTRGQMRFASVAFVVRPNGFDVADIVFVPTDGGDAMPGGADSPGNFAQVALRPGPPLHLSGCADDVPPWPEDAAAVLAHEFGHYALDLVDEYDSSAHADCAMACRFTARFCSSTDPGRTAPKPGCRERLTAKFGLAWTDTSTRTNDKGLPIYRDLGRRALTFLEGPAGAASADELSVVDDVGELWRQVAPQIDCDFRFARQGSLANALGAAAGSTGFQDDHTTRNIVLAGFDELPSPLAATHQLFRKMRLQINRVSPREPDAPLRGFVFASGGTSERVTYPDATGWVDYRCRLLTRLALTTEGVGIAHLHRTSAHGHERFVPHHVVNLENKCRVAVFVACQPPGTGLRLVVTDPDGVDVPTQCTASGGLSFAIVSAAALGSDQLKTGTWKFHLPMPRTAAAAPVAFLCVVHNPWVYIETQRPLAGYEAGQSITLFENFVPMKAAVTRQAHTVRPGAAALRKNPPPGAWGDGTRADMTVDGYKLDLSFARDGYADYRIDFNSDGVTRVLPFQIRVTPATTPRPAQTPATTVGEAEAVAE